MSKKLITEISNDDLLKLINEREDKEAPVEYNNDILDFISAYQMKSGQNTVKSELLYKLYKKWSHHPIPRRTFTTELKGYFPSGLSSNCNYFCLNFSNNKIIQETLHYLKSKNKTKSPVWTKHFNNFLEKFNIERGTFFIKESVLYNLYDKWTYKNNKHNPLSIYQFLKFCGLSFDTKKVDGKLWFGVSKSIIEHLSEDQKNELINAPKSKNQT